MAMPGGLRARSDLLHRGGGGTSSKRAAGLSARIQGMTTRKVDLRCKNKGNPTLFSDTQPFSRDINNRPFTSIRRRLEPHSARVAAHRSKANSHSANSLRCGSPVGGELFSSSRALGQCHRRVERQNSFAVGVSVRRDEAAEGGYVKNVLSHGDAVS
jgi:hypothetical protein